MSTFQVKTITHMTDSFRKEWQSLWDQSEYANLFNSYDWFFMATETKKVNHYIIYAVYEHGMLMAVAPLAPASVYGISVLAPLESHFVVNTPFLVASTEDDLLRALFDALTKHNLYLNKIDAAITENLHKLYPRFFFFLISVNPYVDLSGDPLRLMTTDNRKEIRRMMRKYADHLEFSIVTDQAQILSLLPTIFEIDQKSAKQKRAMSVFTDVANRNTFQDFVRYLHSYISLAILRYDGQPIAYVFNFFYKQVYLPYQASYLFEYRRVSAGKVTMTKLLESMGGTVYKIFDFSGGVSSYKRDFTPLYYLQYNLNFSKNPITMIWWTMINRVRRIKQVLFPLKNTRDHEFLFKTYIPTNTGETV